MTVDSTFFCFTCRMHKPLSVQQPGTSGKGRICITCHARRARIVEQGGGKKLTKKQTRQGERVIFKHLHRIGEI